MSSAPAKPGQILHIDPPGTLLSSYDRHVSPSSQPSSIPRLFLDAMSIRETVFCHEQAVLLENEFDDDDARSYHWVIYHDDPTARTNPPTTSVYVVSSSNTNPVPAGTIRLVPPPHTTDSAAHGSEPYIKLGRLALLPACRKGGFAKALLNTAIEFAEQNPRLLGPGWKGLVLVHAQAALEGYYAQWGFERDVAMGSWDEEGIIHVGMWKRLSGVGAGE